MMGVKGIDYLDAIWKIANSRGCKCNTDEHFAQDFLGEVGCDKCKTLIVSQSEVNEMETNNILPTPKLSNKKLSNWLHWN